MKNVLVSNDDGVYAPGLNALVTALKTLEHTVIQVVAPDRDRSGASNSLTLNAPLKVRRAGNGYLMVDGTPTDCVHLAITGLLAEEPSMVLAGINAGANLGDDVLYSGTVAAATEGRFLGYPALAISLVSKQPGVYQHYDSAARIVTTLLEKLAVHPLPADTILNINIPDIPYAELQGITVTRLGHRHRAEPVFEQQDPRGQKVYWIGPAGSEADAGPGTDFYAIKSNQVSITPLQVDLTCYRALDPLAHWISEVTL